MESKRDSCYDFYENICLKEQETVCGKQFFLKRVYWFE